MNYKAAYTYLANIRPFICPNPGFLMQLFEWKRKYHSMKSTKEEKDFLKEMILFSSQIYKPLKRKNYYA